MHISPLESYILGFISGALTVMLHAMKSLHSVRRAEDREFKRYWQDKSGR